MNIIIAGSRFFNDYLKLEKECSSIISNYDNPTIISGHATGSDALGELFAKNNNIPCKIFPANWNKYGKSAGPIRNAEMAKHAGQNGILILFWDGKSKGSLNMKNTAKKYGLKIFEFLI